MTIVGAIHELPYRLRFYVGSSIESEYDREERSYGTAKSPTTEFRGRASGLGRHDARTRGWKRCL